MLEVSIKLTFHEINEVRQNCRARPKTQVPPPLNLKGSCINGVLLKRKKEHSNLFLLICSFL